MYVLYSILRRWKHRSVSRQWQSSTSARSCGCVLNLNKLEMPGYAGHAPVESGFGAVWRGVGLSFRFMRTEFPPPQAANIMPRLRQAAPTTMLGWLHATFYHATTTQSQRYAVEGDHFVPKSHEFGPSIADPTEFCAAAGIVMLCYVRWYGYCWMFNSWSICKFMLIVYTAYNVDIHEFLLPQNNTIWH